MLPSPRKLTTRPHPLYSEMDTLSRTLRRQSMEPEFEAKLIDPAPLLEPTDTEPVLVIKTTTTPPVKDEA